ncbi:ATP-dependent DNA helicase RecG [Lysobacter sp. HDW10]|uniref:ATP-dependent DNA helicase RecG n=1 Tax=Lysobacter sp. HDW10 TaxID=2714936 RepID=UPI00140D0551|nr:ATP-dependent DNA helicase RecG [Lysobacter sp. HDW10]QIK81065.1 ATP-dependent DNA helicase RecG [Lysobacter sp. HDW10]
MPRQVKPAPDLAQQGERALSTLPGIGPAIANKLAAAGLLQLRDLWFWLPRSYEDRTRLTEIVDLRNGEVAQFEGRVASVEHGFRFRPLLRVHVQDDAGHTVALRFFHFRRQQVDQFKVGMRVRCHGTPRPGARGYEIVHPSYRLLAEADEAPLNDRLDPVYSVPESISAASMRRWVGLALEHLPADDAIELVPESDIRHLHLPKLRDALLTLHQPPADVDLALLQQGLHPAQRRIALEELLAHHLSLRRRRMSLRSEPAIALVDQQQQVEKLLAALPFKLTHAQERSLQAVIADLSAHAPMMRLLQGDVGSGKTVVAALAAMHAVGAGYQAAIMAPTDLLSEQHFKNLDAWLTPLGVRVVRLSGRVVGKARAETLKAIAEGEAQVVVGTHALMQEAIAFKSLAFVVIDEQHRFGVQQRLALRDKGLAAGCIPHQLVMTATPIPRTLAMSAYADLDVSVIDELPPGRTPIQTVAIDAQRRDELVARVQAACAEGRQAYWVCTLIDESDEIEAQAAEATLASLQERMPNLRIGMVHGRIKPKARQDTMAQFKQGALDILVATTVIEVGVDVPNASLMVIENAERLGLAQLHQLRGRVGRGTAASTCVLMYQSPLGAIARERIDTLRATTDGFKIAEKDMALRGPGELLGTRQTGLAAFRVADLMRDADLLPTLHVIADDMLLHRPTIADQLVARWVGSAERYASA